MEAIETPKGFDVMGMLMSVATIALGYAVGLMVYNKFLAGGMVATTPVTDSASDDAAEEADEEV